MLWNLDIMTPGALPLNRLHGAHLEDDAASTTYDPYYAAIPFFYLCRPSATGASLVSLNPVHDTLEDFFFKRVAEAGSARPSAIGSPRASD